MPLVMMLDLFVAPFSIQNLKLASFNLLCTPSSRSWASPTCRSRQNGPGTRGHTSDLAMKHLRILQEELDDSHLWARRWPCLACCRPNQAPDKQQKMDGFMFYAQRQNKTWQIHCKPVLKQPITNRRHSDTHQSWCKWPSACKIKLQDKLGPASSHCVNFVNLKSNTCIKFSSITVDTPILYLALISNFSRALKEMFVYLHIKPDKKDIYDHKWCSAAL